MSIWLLCMEGARTQPSNYQKLCVRDTHVWGIRKGQPSRSAMDRPHLKGTAFLITVNLHAR